jgi:hypothetical protein
MEQTEVWQSTYKTCDLKSLHGTMCGPHWTICILKGKDGAEIDFMCLTMINPATSWFKIIELPVVETSVIPMDTHGVRAL